MFDSSGKLPDGIFADSIEFCDFLARFSPAILGGQYVTCQDIIAAMNLPDLISLKGLITIPMGNTKAYGSFDGCLDSKSIIPMDNMTYNPLGLDFNFRGKHVPLAIYSTIDLESLFGRRTEKDLRKRTRPTLRRHDGQPHQDRTEHYMKGHESIVKRALHVGNTRMASGIGAIGILPEIIDGLNLTNPSIDMVSFTSSARQSKSFLLYNKI